MKWLITGGCGFIGVNLVSRLATDRQNEILVLDDLSVGTAEDLDCAVGDSSKVSLLVADICDERAVEDAAAGADVVVHLAANTGVAPSVENPRHDCVTNVIGTLNVLEAARVHGVRRVVFASSGAPIGECEPPIHEELAPHPVSPYGASKLAGEGYCSAYFHSFGVEAVALRFGNVYGRRSRHKSSVVAKFIRHALSDVPLEIYGDGAQTRDFIFVDDLVDAILAAAARPGIGGEVFQIATHHETSVNELVDELKAVLKAERPELDLEIQFSEARVGDVRRNFSDTTKAKELLGWQAKTALPDGLRKTLAWFAEQASQA